VWVCHSLSDRRQFEDGVAREFVRLWFWGGCGHRYLLPMNINRNRL